MEAIKTIGLTKKYKDLIAVDDLNLEVGHGELFSLLGINGAGKTTTIKMLSCLIKSTSGDAFIEGNSIIKDGLKVKGIIGVSPQETAVAPNLSVKENLEFICEIHGFSKEKNAEKIEELSKQLGLENILHKKAGKLSGGLQRRLSIAMALISEPSVLFLDEPTLGLDVIARSELWDIINGLKGRTTVILTTHYMEEAESLSDRIGIMKNGKLLAVGTAQELIKMTASKSFEDAFISIVKGEKK
ncbi:MAG: ATP-binding cassette domain-containing protein [Oscillospiraceae bacterium]|nr:ATP-binding cassette domain-containing protein [Oscillospiraceae bacterium]